MQEGKGKETPELGEDELDKMRDVLVSEMLSALDCDPIWPVIDQQHNNAFPISLVVARALNRIFVSTGNVADVTVEIVHGTATSADDSHKKFNHSWVEVTIWPTKSSVERLRASGTDVPDNHVANGCVDFSGGHRVFLNARSYLMAGNIDAYLCKRYDVESYMRLCLEHDHFGPFVEKVDKKKLD